MPPTPRTGLLLLALAALLSACSEEPAPDAADLPATSKPDAPLVLVDVPTFSLPHASPMMTPLDPNDIDALGQRVDEIQKAMPLVLELESAMASTTDWRVAEAAADRLVPRLPDLMRPGAQRDAAQQLVYRINSLPTLDPEAVDALVEHTRTMAHFGSAEGDDILRVLIRLDGRVDESVRADIAGTAARHLGTAFTAQAKCVGCTVEEALDGMWPATRASMDPLLYDVQTVHRELARIARNGAPMP